ncbi:Hypothetical protein NTJ_05188 [Nesidiocoris tenuis]|uniref:SRCR domain-containing protein n=1 Tax=Nesidiocoris tenuis TaxID=355587 RepID=A0ABN7AJG5_9HEMI|nr:Hypothetical protein NTJ_05188 [Nesidiocoris tenuis]
MVSQTEVPPSEKSISGFQTDVVVPRSQPFSTAVCRKMRIGRSEVCNEVGKTLISSNYWENVPSGCQGRSVPVECILPEDYLPRAEENREFILPASRLECQIPK